MKKLFIVANWKSNKTTSEAHEWLLKAERGYQFIANAEREVIVCPSFTSLPSMKAYIIQKNLPFKMGAQNVSPFEEGAFTGEVSAKQIKEVADHVIIGHSERRKEFGENDEMLTKKVQMALKYDLIPIFCVPGVDTPIPQGISVVAYEPLFAIGTGNPDTPEDAEMVAKTIKEKHGAQCVLYGGSVKPEDVKSFTQMPSVDGVLVGGASLDADKFLQIIENA